MAEYAAHIKAHDTMAGAAIDGRYGMAVRRSYRRNAMAGIAAEIRDHGGGVVRIGTQEADSRVAIATLGAGIRVRGAGRLTNGNDTVVTTGARSGNARMIKAAVGVPCQKTGGIVAVVALGAGRQMKFGFTDCQNTVMAFAAITKHFLVVDKRNDVKTQGSMAGLAHTTGSDVVR